MKVGTLEELNVDSLAFGGDGVARRTDGKVVFVRRGAPGDRLLARIARDRGSFAFAEPVRIIRSGPARRKPDCGYYERCGGCQLQHVTIEAQRDAKRAAVRESLARIGRVAIDVPPVQHAGSTLGYRNRVTFTLRRADGRVEAGYRHRSDPASVVDITDCPLAEGPIRAAWLALRHGWGNVAKALPAGEELRITLRASEAGRLTLFVAGGIPGRPGMPGRVAGAVPGLHSYHWSPDGGGRVLLAGSARLPDRWRGIRFELGPQSFIQVNRAVGSALEAHLDALVGPVRGRRILDLYSGLGSRAIAWAARGARVTAVEVDEEAAASGRRAATEADVDVEMLTGRVEDLLPGALPADVIVVNPPRCGMSRRAREVLARSGAERLVYVSCDPTTLARDAHRLQDAWEVSGVQPFDLFPQTFHVETVADMRARPGGTTES
jgi:23S rRNA (uracil1939-C5)-methyltransferase